MHASIGDVEVSRREYETAIRLDPDDGVVHYALAVLLRSALVDPDGTAVMLGPDDHVRDATGWANYQGTGNEVAWASTAADLGASWDGNFGLQQNIATVAS